MNYANPSGIKETALEMPEDFFCVTFDLRLHSISILSSRGQQMLADIFFLNFVRKYLLTKQLAKMAKRLMPCYASREHALTHVTIASQDERENLMKGKPRVTVSDQSQLRGIMLPGASGTTHLCETNTTGTSPRLRPFSFIRHWKNGWWPPVTNCPEGVLNQTLYFNHQKFH